jgi:hypothetical protein
MTIEDYLAQIDSLWVAIDNLDFCCDLVERIVRDQEIASNAHVITAEFARRMVSHLEGLPAERAIAWIDPIVSLGQAMHALREAKGLWSGDLGACDISFFGSAVYAAAKQYPGNVSAFHSLRPTGRAPALFWHAAGCAIASHLRWLLLLEIPKAWASTPYPGDAAMQVDDYPESTFALVGKHWRDLMPSDLHAHASELSSMSALGVHFLAPAFMIASTLGFSGIGVGYVYGLKTNAYKFAAFISPEQTRVFSLWKLLVSGLPDAIDDDRVDFAEAMSC